MTAASQYMTLIDFQEQQRKERTLFRSFDEWVKGVPDEYLLCRDFGHVWQGDGWEGDHVECRPVATAAVRGAEGGRRLLIRLPARG